MGQTTRRRRFGRPSGAIAIGLVSGGLVLSHTARAAEPDSATRGAARQLATSGVEAYTAGDYKNASEKLERAYAALKVPSLGLWSARALIKLDHWVEASERLLEVTRMDAGSGDMAVQKAARADAETELAALASHIPSAVLDVRGVPSAEISIDGRPMASSLIGAEIPVDPGTHTFRATNGGRVVEQAHAFQPDARSQHIVLDFAGLASAPTPTPATQPAADVSPPPSSVDGGTRRTVGLVTAGAGLVGIGVGAVFYFKAKSNNDEAKSICRTSLLCLPSDVRRHSSLVDDVKSEATVSYVALGIGGAALVTGAVLYLTAPSASSSTQQTSLSFALSPLPGGGYMGIGGVL